MHNTIKMAREALILFLLSLPSESKFNVCSYGSQFEFLFPEVRSVPYNDENCQEAIMKVQEFDADFGGTEIFNPLKHIFDFGKPEDC